MLLLDSTVLIDYLRGRAAVARVDGLLSRGEYFATTGINVEEITRGLRAGEESAVGKLLDGLRVVPIGRGEGSRAGHWRREFAAKGVTLGQADCLIAAAAVSIGAPLATGNPRDFPMPDLTVEHWPVG